MRKRLSQIILSAITAAFAISCPLGANAQTPSLTTNSSLAQANNEFGFKLLRELVKAEPGRNIVISPFSLATVLQIVRNGAAGETRNEIDNTLEIAGLATTDLADAYVTLARSLKTHSTNSVLEIANAIWFAPNIRLNPPFESLTRQFYDTQLGPLDFTDPRAAGMVNSWVSDKTHGRIPQLLQGSLPGNTAALLVNTAYFKGKWTTPFDPAKTHERPFHIASSRRKPAQMMENSAHFLYCRDSDAQVVRLPYADERVGMLVLLPSEGSSAAQLLQRLTTSKWVEYASRNLQKIKGHILLPRLKLDFQAELNQSLTQIGIRRAFTRSADFSVMTAPGQLFIDEAFQKVAVEVNEEGTTAAAASAIRMSPTAVEAKSFEMVVDRPFVFAICDRETQTILFLGIVHDPAQ